MTDTNAFQPSNQGRPEPEVPQVEFPPAEQCQPEVPQEPHPPQVPAHPQDPGHPGQVRSVGQSPYVGQSNYGGQPGQPGQPGFVGFGGQPGQSSYPGQPGFGGQPGSYPLEPQVQQHRPGAYLPPPGYPWGQYQPGQSQWTPPSGNKETKLPLILGWVSIGLSTLALVLLIVKFYIGALLALVGLGLGIFAWATSRKTKGKAFIPGLIGTGLAAVYFIIAAVMLTVGAFSSTNSYDHDSTKKSDRENSVDRDREKKKDRDNKNDSEKKTDRDDKNHRDDKDKQDTDLLGSYELKERNGDKTLKVSGDKVETPCYTLKLPKGTFAYSSHKVRDCHIKIQLGKEGDNQNNLLSAQILIGNAPQTYEQMLEEYRNHPDVKSGESKVDELVSDKGNRVIRLQTPFSEAFLVPTTYYFVEMTDNNLIVKGKKIHLATVSLPTNLKLNPEDKWDIGAKAIDSMDF